MEVDKGSISVLCGRNLKDLGSGDRDPRFESLFH